MKGMPALPNIAFNVSGGTGCGSDTTYRTGFGVGGGEGLKAEAGIPFLLQISSIFPQDPSIIHVLAPGQSSFVMQTLTVV